LGGGLFELRIDTGPGYRIYCAMIGRTCVLLLCGGDKRKQSSDIQRPEDISRIIWRGPEPNQKQDQ
jgi:putative addiction module killer protein